MEFLLEKLQEIAQALFMKKVQPTMDAINAVEYLEAHRERILSAATSSSRFEDQTLISGL